MPRTNNPCQISLKWVKIGDSYLSHECAYLIEPAGDTGFTLVDRVNDEVSEFSTVLYAKGAADQWATEKMTTEINNRKPPTG